MNTKAIDFLNMWEIYNEGTPMTATEDQKQTFIASLKEIHAAGYYVAVNKQREWKLSNKNPEKLQLQIDTFDQLIEATFRR